MMPFVRSNRWCKRSRPAKVCAQRLRYAHSGRAMLTVVEVRSQRVWVLRGEGELPIWLTASRQTMLPTGVCGRPPAAHAARPDWHGLPHHQLGIPSEG